MANTEDRAFLDTNVLFSASYSEDSDFLRLWQLQGVTLIVSDYVIDEVYRNAVQAEHRRRLGQLLLEVHVILKFDWEGVQLPDDMASLRQKDVPVMQAAIAAQATHLITGDRHDFGDYFGRTIAGVEIIQPAEYLRRHSQGG